MSKHVVVEVPYGRSGELRLLATLTDDGRPVLKATDERDGVMTLTNAIGVPLVARVRAAVGLSEDGPVWLYKLDSRLHRNVWRYDAASDDFTELATWTTDLGLVEAIDRLMMDS